MIDPILSPDFLYDARERENRVRRLQRMLRTVAHGTQDSALNTAENGVYDETTRAAVRAFQQKYGLSVTGTVDLKTWELLREVMEMQTEARAPAERIAPFVPPERTVKLGEYSDLVLIIQLLLNALRLYYDEIAPLPLSGRFDRATEAAVRTFQRANLLPQSGEVERTSWNRLAQEYNRIIEENQ